ncbi:MAG: hypothetical protein ABSC23_16620 [Bryobacteraceae bacterium]
MDTPAERYKKDQDLMFQEIVEKALLQEHAIENERAGELLNKVKIARVEWRVIVDMLLAGKDYNQIIEFLNTKIARTIVEAIMARHAATGKPISEEDARKEARAVLLGKVSK